MVETEDRGPSLVLGLGNPGSEYRATRHNLGFRVVDELAERRGIALDRQECRAVIGGRDDLLLAQPMTYMNRSGYAARCLCERRHVAPRRMLVVYDEVWLPLGRLRARSGGGPGGHRGMESVIQSLRTDEIPRLRLGVGWEGGPPEGVDLVAHVLDGFPPEDDDRVAALVARAADACEHWVEHGIQATMDRFNGLH